MMNGFFWALLRDLGFEVYSVSVYVLENADSMGDLGHRSNIVTIDGRKYFTEVGFGRNSAARCAVPCKKIQLFRDFIAYPQEFHLPNKGLFHSPENPMAGKKVCHLQNVNGETYSIADDVFSQKTKEGYSSRKIKDDADLRNILKKYFGIELQ